MSNRLGAAAVILALSALPGVASAKERGGFLADVQLGFTTANFSLDENDGGDTGAILAFDLGYAWQSGFALTGGLSVTAFAYELRAGSGANDPTLADLTLGFSIFEISGWYFLPLSPQWELYARVGAGPSKGTMELKAGDTKLSNEESSAGFVVSGGANVFFSETGTFALGLEIFHRRYGVTFKTPQLEDKELASTGVTLVARWR